MLCEHVTLDNYLFILPSCYNLIYIWNNHGETHKNPLLKTNDYKWEQKQKMKHMCGGVSYPLLSILLDQHNSTQKNESISQKIINGHTGKFNIIHNLIGKPMFF